MAAAVDRWGRLDTVVRNAGAALDDPEPGESSTRSTGCSPCTCGRCAELANAAVPVMAESGGGAFVVMSSIAGLRGNRVLSGYGVTKAANAQIARNLAVQWGPSGVRANAISPGVIETEFARPITDDATVAATRRDRTPLRRFGRVDEVAGAVVWLASPRRRVRHRPEHRDRRRNADLGLSVADDAVAPAWRRPAHITPINARHHQVQLP